MQVNQQAPVYQSDEIFIQASPEAVWAVLTDINNWPSWNPRISRATMNGDAGAGATFNWKINGSSIRSTLHTVEPVHAIGWQGFTFGASAIHNWYLESEGDGTLVRVEESMDGWLLRLFKAKMNRDLATDMKFWLTHLKAACEA